MYICEDQPDDQVRFTLTPPLREPFLAAKGDSCGETLGLWCPILRRAGGITVAVNGVNGIYPLEITYKQARLLLLKAGVNLQQEWDLRIVRYGSTLDGCACSLQPAGGNA